MVSLKRRFVSLQNQAKNVFTFWKNKDDNEWLDVDCEQNINCTEEFNHMELVIR